MKNIVEKICLYLLGMWLWIKERIIFFAIGAAFFCMGCAASDFDNGNLSFTYTVMIIIFCGSLMLTLIKLYLLKNGDDDDSTGKNV